MTASIGMVTLLLFVLPLGTYKASSQDNPISCKAGTFYAGQNASITCSFGVNMNRTPYDFEIMRYPFTGAGDVTATGIDALRCRSLAPGSFECRVGEGFYFDNRTTDEVTLTIHNVSSDFEGVYACEIFSPDNRPRDKCKLIIKDLSYRELPVIVNPSTFPNQETDHFQRQLIALVKGILVVLVLLFVVGIIIMGCYCISYLKKRGVSRPETGQQPKTGSRPDQQPENNLREDSGTLLTEEQTENNRCEVDEETHSPPKAEAASLLSTVSS